MRPIVGVAVLIALASRAPAHAQYSPAAEGAPYSQLSQPPDELTALPPVPEPVVPGSIVSSPSPTGSAPADGSAASPVIGLSKGPNWSFQADVLFLQRSGGSSEYLGQTTVGYGGPTVDTLSANDVDYSMQPGARFALRGSFNDLAQWELLYFGLQNWSASNTLSADPYTGTLASSPYTQVDKLIGGFDQSLGYSYNSRLQNVELNARRYFAHGPWTLSPLVGFRYFQWNEGFSLTGADQFFGVTENVNSKAGNYLVGLQGGADLRWNWNRFSVDVTGKAGIFANFIKDQQSSGYVAGSYGFPGSGAFVPVSSSSKDVGAAGVFDFSVVGAYHLGQHFELRAGYQLLYVTGLSLAADQLSGESHRGGVFLQGPMAGLQANW